MSNPTVAFLRNYNCWRRGDETLEQPCPRQIGEAIDNACDQIEGLQRERDEAREIAEDLLEKNAKQAVEIIRLKETHK